MITAPTVGTQGSYSVLGYIVSICNGSCSSPVVGVLTVNFASVPVDIVNAVYTSQTGATFNPSSAVTSGAVQYTAASNGVMNLTFYFTI